MNYKSISPAVLEPRLPELGRVKIGGNGEIRRSKNGKEFRLPVKYDSFRIVTRAKDDQDNWILDKAVHDKVGPKPRELDVRLLWDEPEQNFQFFLAAYEGRTRRCTGNGIEAQDAKDGKIPCTCPLLSQHEGAYKGPIRPVGRVTCKPHGRLSMILEAAESFGGFYVFRTTSWESIRNIASQLQMYQAQFGFLAGLPLKLVMYPAQDSYEADGDGGKVTKTSESYKVALVLRANYMKALEAASQARADRERLALPAGADAAGYHQKQLMAAEEVEAEEIAVEFHPETQDGYEAPDDPEYEVVEDTPDPERDRIEALCTVTLELMEWDQIRINRQLAKYAGRLPELLAILEREQSADVKQAAKMIAEKGSATEAAEPEPEDESTDEPEDDQPDLF